MDSKELSKRVAYLEFINDQLTSEIKYIDSLLRSIGFPEGLNTVKEAAEEIQLGDPCKNNENNENKKRRPLEE